MSLSSGAYFAIHSGVSQCLRSTSAARVALLEWMGPLSRTMVTGARHSRLGAMDAIEPFEQGDEIGAAFGLRGHDSELAGNEVERAHHGDLLRLAGSLDAQVGSPFCPGTVGQRLRFIGEQQHNVARQRLLLHQ